MHDPLKIDPNNLTAESLVRAEAYHDQLRAQMFEEYRNAIAVNPEKMTALPLMLNSCRTPQEVVARATPEQLNMLFKFASIAMREFGLQGAWLCLEREEEEKNGG